MKRFLVTMSVVLSLSGAVHTQAQGVSFGVKGGYNVTDMKFDNANTGALTQVINDNKNGWYIGPTLKASFAGGLGADIAVFYDQRESKFNDEETLKQQYVYVPLNLRYNIGLGSLAGIYLAAGPQVGFNIGDSELSWKGALSDALGAGLSQVGYYPNTGGNGTLDEVNNTFQLKKSNFSINLGAGIYLTKHFEVGFAYNIPLGKTADMERKYDGDLSQIISSTYDDVTNIDVKNNTWQVSAAIYF